MKIRSHNYRVVIADGRVQDLVCCRCGTSYDEAIVGRVGCQEGLEPRVDAVELWGPMHRAIPHAPMAPRGAS